MDFATRITSLVRINPYQFRNSFSERYEFHGGWLSEFESVCGQVDALVGGHGSGFHWTQLKEKLGTARWYWSMSPIVEADVRDKITQLVVDAENRTRYKCIVCGAKTQGDGHSCDLPVCEAHQQYRSREAVPEWVIAPWGWETH